VSRPNLFTSDFEYDPEDLAGFRGGMVNVGKLAGGEGLAVKLFELPPGEKLCPYHYEYVEEWLLVLDGEVDLRTPGGTERLARGTVTRFAPGPEGAHQVSTPADQPAAARILMFSSAAEPSVAVYPDSDKIGVWPGNPDDTVMLRRADGHRPYYDGETP
jgi:uncharacterized cupin superfamily protein